MINLVDPEGIDYSEEQSSGQPGCHFESLESRREKLFKKTPGHRKARTKKRPPVRGQEGEPPEPNPQEKLVKRFFVC